MSAETAQELALDFYDLYRAGKVYLPDAANSYANVSRSTHDLEQNLAYLSESTGHAWPLYHTELMRQTLLLATRKSSLHLAEAGQAIVAIGHAFEHQDTEAAQDFRNIAAKHGDLLNSVPTPSSPSGSGDPYGTIYDPPPLDPPVLNGSWLHNLGQRVHAHEAL